MKKFIFSVLLASVLGASLYANDMAIFNQDKGFKGFLDSNLFFYSKYDGAIDETKISSVQRQLNNLICGTPKLKKYVNSGAGSVFVEYEYSNKTVLVSISHCR